MDEADDSTTDSTDGYALRPVGRVDSTLHDRHDAPRQPDESAPAAVVVIDEAYGAALDGLSVGDRIVVLTWLHLGSREELRAWPRGDRTRAQVGVFATRSPERPNPIGLHEVTLTGIDGRRLHVDHLEALDGTPVLDVKPVLGPIAAR